MEVVASLSQGRTAAEQCGLFTYKSVPVIFELPCNYTKNSTFQRISRYLSLCLTHNSVYQTTLEIIISDLIEQMSEGRVLTKIFWLKKK